MKHTGFLTGDWLREALRRLVQHVFGIFLFDFPGLLSLRLIAFRAIFQIGRDVIVGRGAMFVQPHGLSEGSLKIGDRTKIHHSVEVDYSGGVTIGDEVWISQNVLIETHEHVIGPGPKDEWPITTNPLEIADGAWIGANAIILPGVRRIGRNTIVGAGAVVTQDVPDETIVGGVPARNIGSRNVTAQLRTGT
jgi:acetyltransferase-like isoleucine patch superfamily enzyme